MSDYYKILGVSKKASSDDIKKAYRSLAKKYHPDKNPDGSTEEKFKQISEAYATLSDPTQRQSYDQFGSGASTHRRSANMHDIFEGFGFDGIFDSFFRGGQQNKAHRGRDFLVDISISFEEAAHGCTTSISVSNNEYCSVCGATGAAPGAAPVDCARCYGTGKIATRQGFFTVTTTCDACGGLGKVIKELCVTCKGEGMVESQETLSVRIPAGINSGGKIKIPRKGELGPGGGGHGDLLVRVHIEPHHKFERRDCDIFSAIDLNVAEAALGCQKTVSTLHGEKTVNFPMGTQPGHKLRLKGMGVPSLKKDKMGNHIIEVRVEVPTTLTSTQHSLFEQIKKTFLN